MTVPQSARNDKRVLASPRALLAAEEILDRWMTATERAALDRIVQAGLRNRTYLNSAERRWIGDAVFGTVRYLRRQNRILNSNGESTGARDLIALWARQSAEGAEETRSESGLPGPTDPEAYLRETLSFPDEMAADLEAALGPEAPEAAEALNRQAPTTLRVNTIRTSRPAALERLPGAVPGRYSPWAIELPARPNIAELSGFREGWFELQEEASQLIALLTDARPGQTIIDVGAGAGGKSLALAAMMQNKGRIAALDISADRLEQLRKRALRAGARCIRPLSMAADEAGIWQLSGATARSVDRLRGRGDCVLVDAPCSGTGVLRRSPDLKWQSGDRAGFAQLQLNLMEQSASLVAPGGYLVYATCAFERAQDEAVIERFLASPVGAAFEVIPSIPRLREAIDRVSAAAEPFTQSGPDLMSLASGPFLRTWPHRNGMDAFFAACLRRNSSDE